MKEELHIIAEAVEKGGSKQSLAEFMAAIFDAEQGQFSLQENVLLDYKEAPPEAKDKDYRSGLLKLIAAFHNAFGGVIVFGVRDSDLKPVGVKSDFDVEKYNSLFGDIFGYQIELVKRTHVIQLDGESKNITVVFIPRRVSTLPVRAQVSYGQIKDGSLYVRERHEALVASNRHLPFLFSTRDHGFEHADEAISNIQYSAPPSPSTLPKFVGRFDLSLKLWEWLLVDRKPRIYLSGPGGSGKSTLAYEFMDQIARGWSDLRLRNGEHLDFVSFVSAKETELDVRTGKERAFSLRQFTDAEGLYRLILTSIGAESAADLDTDSRESLLEKIEHLFNNFNGLIVIDDIDALSRQDKDTGEEDLILLASQAPKEIKVIYTLRNDASYAKNAALPVPGLDENSEIPAFIDACCELFGTERPNESIQQKIVEQSSRLPLLIETIIGLRTNSSSYDQALRDFRERGGDSARSYLYQREYEKLSQHGKGRQLLAALMLYQGTLGFDSICTITNTQNNDAIRAAINETANIFLKVSTADDGTTEYGLSPSAASFVRTYSENLPYFNAIERAVEHFKANTLNVTPREASIISRAEQHLRAKQFDSVVSLIKDLGQDDTVLVNPKFMSIWGRALVQSNPVDLVKARDLFRAAENFGFHDIFMYRAWYHAEKLAGYRYSEAIDVCRKVIGNNSYSDRNRSEFCSKIGECLSAQARSISGVDNPDKAKLFAESVAYYLWAICHASIGSSLDLSKTHDWLSRAMQGYIQSTSGDYGILVRTIENEVKRGLVIGEKPSEVIQDVLVGTSRVNSKKLLQKSQATLGFAINALARMPKKYQPSVAALISAFTQGKKSFEVTLMHLTA